MPDYRSDASLHLITSSAAFAAEAHLHQVRKELNEPYIVHPLRVANMAARLGEPPEFIAACHLHDVVEDTTIPLRTIASLFPEWTTQLVDAMTKWWGESQDPETVAEWKQQYYRRLVRVPGGPLLKVLDRTDNLRDFTRLAQLAPQTHRWAARYATKTRQEFVEHPILFEALDAKYAPVRDEFDAALRALEASV